MVTGSAYTIVDDEYGAGRILVLKGPWTDECKERLEQDNLTGIRLSYSAGFRGADITFIADFPTLRSLQIYSYEVSNLIPIGSLPNLEVLGLQTKGNAKHVTLNLGALRVALLQWRPGMDQLLIAMSLRYINIINYPYLDLQPLSALTRLERLSLTSRKLTSLQGIHRFTTLKHLDLYNCPNLRSIAESQRCPMLQEVEIEACRFIQKK